MRKSRWVYGTGLGPEIVEETSPVKPNQTGRKGNRRRSCLEWRKTFNIKEEESQYTKYGFLKSDEIYRGLE